MTSLPNDSSLSTSLTRLAERPIWPKAPSWLPACVAGLIMGWLYYVTSASTISWQHDAQDSGELAACATVLGIAHPTGYPFYTLLGWCLIHLFHPMDPGRVMALLSVVCGALAVAMIARAGALAVYLMGTERGMSVRGAGWWGALAAGYAGMNPLLWSQAVVCEVYSLAILLQAIVWFYVLKYLDARRNGRMKEARMAVIGIGLVLGLIMAHHVAGAAVLLPIVAIFIARPLPRPIGDVFRFGLSMIPGLLFYLYLPLRSAQNPPLDWGYPHDLVNFLRHVTAYQYRGFMFGVDWTVFLRRLATFEWQDYWGTGGVLFLLVGLAVTGFSSLGKAGRALSPAILLYLLWSLIFASGYRVSDYHIFYYPMMVPAALAIAPGIAWLATWMRKYNRLLPAFLALLVGATIMLGIGQRWVDMDVSDPWSNSAAFFATRALVDLPEHALAISYSDGDSFALLYAVNCGITDPNNGQRLLPRPDVDAIVANWVRYDWFYEYVNERWGRYGRVRFISPSHERDVALRHLVDQNLKRRPVVVTMDVLGIIESQRYHYDTIPISPFFFRVVALEPPIVPPQ